MLFDWKDIFDKVLINQFNQICTLNHSIPNLIKCNKKIYHQNNFESFNICKSERNRSNASISIKSFYIPQAM